MLEFICIWIILVVIIVGMYILSFQLDNPFSRIADECFDDFSHKFYVFCKRQKRDYILAISFICFAYMLLSAFKIPWLSCLNHRYPYGGCPLGSSAPLIVPIVELVPPMPHFTSYIVLCPCPVWLYPMFSCSIPIVGPVLVLYPMFSYSIPIAGPIRHNHHSFRHSSSSQITLGLKMVIRS